jgi:hypothetical protein
LILALTLLFL